MKRSVHALTTHARNKLQVRSYFCNLFGIIHDMWRDICNFANINAQHIKFLFMRMFFYEINANQRNLI